MTVDVLRQAGVSVVQFSDEILPVAEGLGLLQQARGKRVAVVADGGGQATIASDRLAEAGLELAELSDTTRARLAEILVPQASLNNPVDVAGTSDADPAVLARCLEIVAEDDNVDSLFLVGMFGGYYTRFAEDLLGGEMRGAESMIELSRRCDKPLVVYSLYEAIRPPALRRLHEAGLPVYASLEQAVRVLDALGERGIYLAASKKATRVPSVVPDGKVQAMFAQAQNEGRDLYEYEAKSLLRTHGVAMPDEVIAHSADELGEVAARFGDEPLVMKVVSKDILHKSDAGGVRLNLRGEVALRNAYDLIMSSCAAYKPDAVIKGVLVTPMGAQGHRDHRRRDARPDLRTGADVRPRRHLRRGTRRRRLPRHPAVAPRRLLDGRSDQGAQDS